MDLKKPVRRRRLRHFLRGSYWLLGGGIALGWLDALSQSIVPLFFRYVLNGIQDDAARFLAEDFWNVVVAGGVLLLLFLPVAYFFHVLLTLALMRFSRNLQVELYTHVQRLSADFFQRYRTGEINARLNADLEAITQAAGPLGGLIWAPAVLLYSLLMMIYIDWKLALVCAGLLAAVSVYTVYFLPAIKRWNRQVRDASGEVSALITELVGLATLVKAYGREEFAEDRVRGLSDKLLLKRERLTWRQFFFTDILQTLTRFGAPMLLLFLGAWWIHGGGLRAGDLAAFWGYWLQLGGVAAGIVMSFSAVMGAAAAADRVLGFFDESPIVKDSPDPVRIDRVRGDLILENVRFRYPVADDDEGPVLHDLNLSLPSGRTTALVGPSGGGKSTLLQLLMRFFDPDGGRILLDGLDLRDLAQDDLRRQMAFVMQDSLFFAGSIADNLRLAVPGATESQLWQALEAANAAEFVRRLPAGLHATLGERGAKLSGGQKQRLSLARAFLKDAPVLLLDEPTSALDSESERKVKEALERLLEGRTAVLVAHRLSTVMDADNLVLLDQGRVVGQGTHEELRATSELYRTLCRQQGL